MPSFPTFYFPTLEDNTDKALELASRRQKELNITQVIVATTSGGSGVKAAGVFSNQHLICVSHAAGFRGANTQELTAENRALLDQAGVKVVTAAHTLSGVSRAIRGKFQGLESNEIMAHTWRTFCEGMKVCAEITLMAADAGLLDVEKPVIALAGTGHGLDTAVMLKPAYSHTIFDLRIMELICMPSPFHPAAIEQS